MNDQISDQMAQAVDTPVVETKPEVKEGQENQVRFIQTVENVGDESNPR